MNVLDADMLPLVIVIFCQVNYVNFDEFFDLFPATSLLNANKY